MEPSDRIIFPLDGMTIEEADKWMFWLRGRIGYVKVGLELFLRAGWKPVSLAHTYGHKVMLDLKLHDIPATMRGATLMAVEAGVALLTVHASAGAKAMKWCVDAAMDSETSIVAVTVLTSLDEQFIQRVYQPARDTMCCIPNIVERLVEEATDEAHVDHFVCSPQEAGLVRALRDDRNCGRYATIITPGIRMAGGETHDQKRTNTPGAAVRDGADLLVIGRPIREAEEPETAIEAICADIREQGNGQSDKSDI